MSYSLIPWVHFLGGWALHSAPRSRVLWGPGMVWVQSANVALGEPLVSLPVGSRLRQGTAGCLIIVESFALLSLWN